MGKQVIMTDDDAPPLGAYSQGFRAGDFIFVTGCGPIGSDGKVKGETVAQAGHCHCRQHRKNSPSGRRISR